MIEKEFRRSRKILQEKNAEIARFFGADLTHRSLPFRASIARILASLEYLRV
jgi:hypothetical protein